MPGILLRSGTLQEFRALGVDGQPAYRSAPQLREAIRLKMGREASNCLAIPQPSESGDRIDWYAPLEGDVVPWSAGTAAERATALAQLERLHEQLLSTADNMREDTQNREKQLFARLLKMTRNFPDEGHVYLVDGKPVVTFWGFTDQAGANEYDPLLCLRPPRRSPAPAVPVSPPLPVEQTQTVPPSTAPAVAGGSRRRSGWRWWHWRWLWLLLPLLLLPLLFLLHTCAPQISLLRINLPGLPNPGISARTGGTDRGSRPGRLPELDISANGRVGGAVMGTEEQPPDLGIPPPEPKGNPEVPAEQTTSLSEPPSSQYPPAPDIPPPELSIPPQALKNGSVDFLNGRWKAGAGIQDAQITNSRMERGRCGCSGAMVSSAPGRCPPRCGAAAWRLPAKSRRAAVTATVTNYPRFCANRAASSLRIATGATRTSNSPCRCDRTFSRNAYVSGKNRLREKDHSDHGQRRTVSGFRRQAR